jgi:hypothetical protein
MARESLAKLKAMSVWSALKYLAIVLVTGKNSDNTTYELPISGEITLDPTNLALDATVLAANALQPPLSPTHTVTNSADMSGAGADVSAAPGGGLKLVVHEIIISSAAAISVVLKEETSGTVIFGPYYMSVNSTIHLSRNRLAKLPTAVKKLRAVASGAGAVTVETWCSTEA